jgi:hypothetical protein
MYAALRLSARLTQAVRSLFGLRGGVPVMFQGRDDQAEDAGDDNSAQGSDQSNPRVSHCRNLYQRLRSVASMCATRRAG